jgi:hypothetical protein
MSTFMNYTYQSFNFRNRQGARPFYDLVASIAAEELNPEGALAYDLPSQPAVFAPGPAPEEIEEIAQKLREAAGLPKEPTGAVAN